jgi:hypothetical protein
MASRVAPPLVALASGRGSLRTGQRPVPPPWALMVLICVGCTPTLHRPAQPLATSLQELTPHANGDHFVYVWKQVSGGVVRAGIHVEHFTSLDNGEFDVTLSEDGALIGHTRFRDDGHALLLVSETFGRNLRLSYDPPLPQLHIPLYPGETRATATVTVSALDDDKHLDTLPVTQVLQASPAPAVHVPLGDYTHGVQVRTVRTLQFPEGPVELSSTALLVPGIGEIRSQGAATGASPLVRELACATIGGRHIGTCRTLREQVEQLERAGPPHAQ